MEKNTECAAPEDRKYSPDHVWLKYEDDKWHVGITDFAQKQLGDIVYVDVEPGQEPLGAGAEFGSIESAKTISSLRMPLAGSVVLLNPALADNPGLINSDCYGKGWIIEIKVAHAEDVVNLLDAKGYLHILGQKGDDA